MKLSELLSAITNTANSKGLSIPYIVGGIPRDKLMDSGGEFNDIDLTTGDETIHYLSTHIAQIVDGPDVSYQVMSDGHSRLKIGGFKLDFSSNFKIPGIVGILKRAGIKDPTDMQQELYSRDFTCNTALMTLDLKKIIDPTGLAQQDIDNKIIKTCLSPDITLGYDNKRIVRAIYLAGKLGFSIEPEVKQWIKDNAGLMANVPEDYAKKKFAKGMKFNPRIVVSLLRELGLTQYTPTMP